MASLVVEKSKLQHSGTRDSEYGISIQFNLIEIQNDVEFMSDVGLGN